MKKNEHDYISRKLLHFSASIISLVSIFLAVFTALYTLLDGNVTVLSLDNHYLWLIVYVIMISITIISLLFLLINRHFFRIPTSLTISLLGLPNSGKTVYLTVLFRELLIQNSLRGVSLYGEETVERVQKDFLSLQNSEWLSPTDISGSNVFYYRAIINSDLLISKPKYKLEIADYAGEFLENELISNDSFFHRTKYFKYVMDSDIIFVIIDLERYYHSKRDYVIEIEKTIIAALEILKQNKSNTKKCRTPIGILLLKSDYLKVINHSESFIKTEFDALLTYAKNHFRNYNTFFVSAISSEPLKDRWGRFIKPDNVIQPLDWALHTVKR
jgi:hypothetical protein